MTHSRVRRRRSRERTATLTFYETLDLRIGPGHGQWGTELIRWRTDAERRRAWEANREEILAQTVTDDGHANGRRPAAFWQYDVREAVPQSPSPDPRHNAPYAHLRYDVMVETAAPEWWRDHIAAIRAQVAFLARNDLLEPHEVTNIENPTPRADGAINEWDAAALAGLADARTHPKENR